MMPLWITATRSPDRWGCAFASVTPPCVAQRVCATPSRPESGAAASFSSSCATLPTVRRSPSLWFGWSTATPAESYPRYSRRLSPSTSTGTILRSAIAPTIPHIVLLASRSAREPAFPPGQLLRLLLRPLPPGHRDLLRPLERELARRRFFRDRRACADRRVGTDAHGRDEHHAGADEHAVADRRLVLVRAVIVAGDRAGADVHVATNLGVAEVGQVVHLAALGDRRLLDLDEVADLHVPGEQSDGE